MTLLRGIAACALSSALTVAAAQTGTDGCTTPDPIAGQGSFPFDSTLASTGLEGQLEGLCYFFGSSTVDNDVWFAWTADVTGTAQISTCTSAVDTKLAAYPGSTCPTIGSAIACNDDSCALQSVVGFPVTMGTTYTLQVGTFPGAAGGTGNLDIAISTSASNDDCTAPAAIAGQGAFAFNNGAATMGAEGQTEALCYFFTNSAIDSDVWFSWTADATGQANVATCNTIFDTKVASYPGGGCPTAGTALACNDDNCGLQSTMSWPVTNGTTYMLQIGTFPGVAGGSGQLDISITTPLTNDDCAAPTAVAGQGAFAFDNSTATTGVEGQTEALCYDFGTSAINNDIWFEWTADITGTATVSTCTSLIDTRLAAYPSGGCPAAGTAIACNDDTCGLQSEVTFPVIAGTAYLLQIGNFPGVAGGTGTFDTSIAGPAEPGTAFCFCDTGNAPCGNGGNPGNGCANGSSAAGANLTGSGIAQVGADTVVLSASGLAPNQPGLYFQGNNAVNGGLGIVFGDGLRCAGQGVIRLGVAVADGTGASDTSGFAQAISVKAGLTAGDLRHYQLWYRDPQGSQCGALFNLTNGYSIQW